MTNDKQDVETPPTDAETKAEQLDALERALRLKQAADALNPAPESEALKMARVQLELVKALKGTEGWQVLGDGLARIASLFEDDVKSRAARPTFSAPYEARPTSGQLSRLGQLLAYAKELYGQDLITAAKQLRQLLDDIAPADRHE
ncbi:MAG TPA: hypothetical protein VMG99_08960 [Thermoplasmata archaeon]|nr:hypothetical protein [Thermoplasmata archaeon]